MGRAELQILEGSEPFKGNTTWLSCEVAFDRELGKWRAESLEGEVGVHDRKDAAVLLCFAKHLGLDIEIKTGA